MSVFESMFTDLGIKAEEYKSPKALSGSGKSPKDRFLDMLDRELESAKADAKKHPITIDKKTGIASTTFPSFAGKGKPPHWYNVKDGKLIVSAYFNNKSLFPPRIVNGWTDVIAVYEHLIKMTKDGSLDSEFEKIIKESSDTRAKNRQKKLEEANQQHGSE